MSTCFLYIATLLCNRNNTWAILIALFHQYFVITSNTNPVLFAHPWNLSHEITSLSTQTRTFPFERQVPFPLSLWQYVCLVRKQWPKLEGTPYRLWCGSIIWHAALWRTAFLCTSTHLLWQAVRLGRCVEFIAFLGVIKISQMSSGVCLFTRNSEGQCLVESANDFQWPLATVPINCRPLRLRREMSPYLWSKND